MANTKWVVLTAVLALLVTAGSQSPLMPGSTAAAAEMNRIGPEEAMEKAKTGEALLVCAYGDENCKTILFEGALLRSELEAKLDALPKTQEIIFY